MARDSAVVLLSWRRPFPRGWVKVRYVLYPALVFVMRMSAHTDSFAGESGRCYRCEAAEKDTGSSGRPVVKTVLESGL